MKTTIEVNLCLWGDNLPIKLIVEKIGLTPTESRKMGEKGRYSTYKEDSIEYSTGRINTLIMQDVFQLQYNTFFPKIDIINVISKYYKLNIKIFIVIRITNNDNVGLYFTKQHINFLNCINAEVDIDILH